LAQRREATHGVRVHATEKQQEPTANERGQKEKTAKKRSSSKKKKLFFFFLPFASPPRPLPAAHLSKRYGGWIKIKPRRKVRIRASRL
jgi:hypothetical protein